MPERLIITGGKKLRGTVRVSGSKNAVLPLLCATLLLKKGTTTLTNVPDISDVHTLLSLMEFLGAKTTFTKNKITVDATKLQNKKLPHELVKKLRASILLLAPLYARFGSVELDFPGGCVIGKRSTWAHEKTLESLGAQNNSTDKTLRFTGKLQANDFTLPEISVTATENALMLAACTTGETTIRLASAEPHVQDLCKFLTKLGARIKGLGTHTLVIKGTKNLKNISHKVCGDYLEVGTLAIAAAVTGGEIRIQGGERHDLDIFWEKLNEIGVPVRFEKSDIIVGSSAKYFAVEKVDTGVFPKFPTDLQAPMGVLLTQCEGRSQIFETLFEGRLAYLYELEKMGARVELTNNHQSYIVGKAELKGASVSSFDLRAGAAMLLAGLCATGQTEVHDIYYLDRGYEKFDEKLRKLGAEIKRV